ncbi:MAG: hypothetical protein AB7F31_00150 [Parachlamydiales bacterium]
MKTLPITLFLLFLLLLLTYGATNSGLDRIVELRAVQGALRAQRASHNGWQEIDYLMRKGKRLPARPRPPKERVRLPTKGKGAVHQPPLILPTKLNLALAFKRSEKGKLYRKLVEELITSLYGECPSTLLDQVQEGVKGHTSSLPESLAALKLVDQQSRWQTMLQGDGSPSLLDYLYYRPTSDPEKLNILWAPRPLLELLLPKNRHLDQLVALQEQMADRELKSEEYEKLFVRFRELADLRDSPYQSLLELSSTSTPTPQRVHVAEVSLSSEEEGP